MSDDEEDGAGMSVSCDRCSERSNRLSDYVNGEGIDKDQVYCHACAEEIKEGNEK